MLVLPICSRRKSKSIESIRIGETCGGFLEPWKKRKCSRCNHKGLTHQFVCSRVLLTCSRRILLEKTTTHVIRYATGRLERKPQYLSNGVRTEVV